MFFGWKKRGRQLEAENAQLKAHAAQLEARLIESQAKNQPLIQALAAATKTSRNSSKPPSSDIVKPPPKPPGKGKKRKIGGQPGHPKQEHPAFTPAQIDHHIPYELAHCPVDPSHRLVPLADKQKIIQQVELVDQPFVVTEHSAQGYWCAGCQRIHYAAFPPAVLAGGLCGPRLTSLVCYLKGKLHGSYSGIQDFFRDGLGLEVSRGYLAKLNQKAAQAFAQPYAQLLALLPQQVHLNIDETGHKENGHRYWTGCFRAKDYLVFKIYAARGSDVLFDILGQNFAGSLGADFWGAYRKYDRRWHARYASSMPGLLTMFVMARGNPGGGISRPATATASCGWQRWAKCVRRPVGASRPFSETWVFAHYGDGIFIVCREGTFAPRRGPPQNQKSAPLFAPQE